MSQELLDMVSNGLGSTTSIIPDDILVRHSISSLKKIHSTISLAYAKY